MVFSEQEIVFLWWPRRIVVAKEGKTQWAWLCRAMSSSTPWSTELYSLKCWYS